MTAQASYVTRILDQYLKLPGTLRRVLRQDRRTALALYRRGIRLDVVENAFVLAIARRTFRSETDHLEPIRWTPRLGLAIDPLVPVGRVANRRLPSPLAP